MNRNLICIIRIPEEVKETESILKIIMVKCFLNLKKEMDIQDNEARKLPNRLNSNGATLKYIITKLSNVKYKEL